MKIPKQKLGMAALVAALLAIAAGGAEAQQLKVGQTFDCGREFSPSGWCKLTGAGNTDFEPTSPPTKDEGVSAASEKMTIFEYNNACPTNSVKKADGAKYYCEPVCGRDEELVNPGPSAQCRTKTVYTCPPGYINPNKYDSSPCIKEKTGEQAPSTPVPGKVVKSSVKPRLMKRGGVLDDGGPHHFAVEYMTQYSVAAPKSSVLALGQPVQSQVSLGYHYAPTGSNWSLTASPLGLQYGINTAASNVLPTFLASIGGAYQVFDRLAFRGTFEYAGRKGMRGEFKNGNTVDLDSAHRVGVNVDATLVVSRIQFVFGVGWKIPVKEQTDYGLGLPGALCLRLGLAGYM